MASAIPQKPPSSSSTPSSSNDENRPTITSYLHLRPSASSGENSAPQPSLDKEMVLRRIRHWKRVNRLHGVLDSFLRSSLELAEKDRRNAGDGWVDDAFSSP
ncbi:hypothetical protein IEQ34_013822 [Dendrobium chrysotoxum]|uniref:Uncharacterized protein n=1 Tax=Dendrobium chrysotoxum TaxID=161865 RepID=A0AAV7GSI4_DENCH|nr:hypothetical protein IEQ34_013822 [Dendrobium chrysotoxum]